MCGFLKACGKRVIVTIHGLDHKRAKWGRFASWYIMKGEQAAVKHADEIIVLKDGAVERQGTKAEIFPTLIGTASMAACPKTEMPKEDAK